MLPTQSHCEGDCIKKSYSSHYHHNNHLAMFFHSLLYVTKDFTNLGEYVKLKLMCGMLVIKPIVLASLIRRQEF